MPIVYDTKNEGWSLKDPTDEELKSLEKFAIEYVALKLAKKAALAMMAMKGEGDDEPSGGVTH